MESTPAKADGIMIKPLFLKAGVPLVLSLAGFFYARTTARRCMLTQPPPLQIKQEETLVDSDCGEEERDDQQMIIASHLSNSIDSSEIHLNFEEEVLGLRSRVEELQKREWDMEKKFLSYHAMREHESVLMELKNMLLLESVRVEFLDREVSSMEADRQIFEKLMVEYVTVLQQLGIFKLENRLLQRKVQKLFRKTRDLSRIIREKNLKIKASEAVIVRCSKELETRDYVVKKLEEEVTELQSIINQLQEEKKETLIKLNSAENSASLTLKNEAETITVENYMNLLNELQQIQKDRAAETAETIYLRWTNACLRHELLRRHQQEKEELQIDDQEKKNHLEIIELKESELTRDCDIVHQKHDPGLGHGESFLGVETSSSHHSKRKKLVQKLKRWVEGSDHHHSLKQKLDEKEKQDIKCLGRHSISEDAEQEHIIHARRSCSSA